MSNEERKNIVRKFKSNQRKREIYNKYNDHYLQLEPAKKKQRYNLMDRAKKDELLETCAKKYKEIDMSKKKQMLENRRKKYKEMDASKKKQMLNRKAVKSRKSYDSMDCEAIAQQCGKISKLHVDVCISQFCQKIKEGPYYVCTVCNRMLYRKSVLNLTSKNMSTATFKTSLQKNYLLTVRNIFVKHATPKSSKEKFLAKQYTTTCL